MTPAARLAAAIEILEEIAAGLAPADDILRRWSRGHRFAGSKDRREISERVYNVLRRRGEYAHAAGSDEPRALVLAQLALSDGFSVDQISVLFDGDKYSPAALTDEERAMLSSGAGEMPRAARLNVPAFLLPALEAAFGNDLEAELSALNQLAPVDLRVNTLKGTREDALEALAKAGIEAEATPESPVGIRLKGHPALTNLDIYKSGLVEPMDEGSQLAALAVEAEPGMQVADLCAGAGGKTLAIAAQMENRGQIYATDSDPRRLGRLAPRMQRAGARNVQPLKWPQDGGFADLEGKCDRVLLDVPCSGSGSWRRHPELKWRLTPEELESLTKTQDALLRTAAPLVKPGGRLIYVTCSVLPVENERRVEGFAAAHPDFAMVPDFPRRLSPHSSGTDGFFMAVLQRKAAP